VTMGRPRLRDLSIPAHIEQTKIPKGAYWSRGDRTWYTIVRDDGKPRRHKLADDDARLSDLHRKLEEFAGVATGTLGWLCEKYHASDKFMGLATTTRDGYENDRKVMEAYELKSGQRLSTVRIGSIGTPHMQRVIDAIGATHPSKANHLLRYLRTVFSWGIRRGYCSSNPAKGVEQAKERKLRRKVEHAAQVAMLKFAQAGACLKAHSKGSISPVIWISMELAYLCRLRGIEVITLTDAHEMPEGIQTNRRKGSLDTLVLWSPRLRAAWKAAQTERRAIWERRGMATPMRAEDRPILVNLQGSTVTRSGMDTLWQSFMKKALNATPAVIAAEQRFGLHDLKRKGITDTKGTRAAKREGSGHKSESMMDIYDQELHQVTTPGGV